LGKIFFGFGILGSGYWGLTGNWSGESKELVMKPSAFARCSHDSRGMRGGSQGSVVVMGKTGGPWAFDGLNFGVDLWVVGLFGSEVGR
jgi:hypothetical protein